MTNDRAIVKFETRQWSPEPETRRPGEPITAQIGSKRIVLIPEDEFRTLKMNQRSWIAMAALGGATGATLLCLLILPNQSPPAVTMPPQIIEKPVVVDRNCIAFCSK